MGIWCHQKHFQIYKVTPDIDFTDEVIVQCYVPVVKILLLVLVLYEWSHINFDVKTYGGLIYCIYLDPVLCIVLVS